MPQLRTLICLSLPVFFLSTMFSVSRTYGQDPEFTAAQLEHFETTIRPLLAKRCFECHGPDLEEVEGGLRFSSRAALLKGGDTGPAIVPGKPDESLLIDSINYGEVYEMPPDSKMPKAEIELLTQWVADSAPWPKVNDAHLAEAKSFDLNKRKESHWCWQLPRKLPVPKVSDSDWALDPIDHFILQKNADAGLKMAPDADRRTWIRRVYFDLIGLPPTIAQVDSFLKDTSKEAHEKVVDQLLASEHFGERWARHWMDLIRYAETCGHEFEYPIPHAFRYRDYLIRAFNQDVPYDQLIREHIAGDLLPSPRLHPEEKFNESILGTGFWFLDEATHAPVDVRLDEANHIDNRIDVMSKTFLGLTVACARCHDHKFDAISTEDYYSLAGFLQSSRRQLAMLDPHGKISASTNKIRQIRQSVQRQLADIQPPQRDLEALQKLLLETNQLQTSQPVKTESLIEAESLEMISNDAGEKRVQDMRPFQGSWSDNKQLFWLADKNNATLKLKLNAPDEGEYELRMSFTRSYDYGIFQLLVGDQKVGEPIDAFSGTVQRVKIQPIGKVQLKAGANELSIKTVGVNPKSNPKRYFVGIDSFELVPTKKTPQKERPSSVVSDEQKLWLEQLKLASIHPDHSLWLWQQVTRNGTTFDKNVLKQLVETSKRAQQLKANRNLPGESAVSLSTESNAPAVIGPGKLPFVFSDFDQPNFGDWFVTGEAFGSQPTRNGHWVAGEKNVMTYPGGMADGSQYSKKLHGVLRSPTFELQSNEIWYRIKGENVRIRLIIDGFVMDIYNALLFGGAHLNVNTKGKFQWIRQAGDIHRYKGHRAHIEIIDQGGGYAVVDQVVFSNGGKPDFVPARAEELLKHVAVAKDLNEFAKLYAQELIRNEALPILGSAGNDAQKIVEDANQMIAAIEREIPNPILAPAMTDGTPENEKIFIRGNPKTLGTIAKRRLLEALVGRKTVDESNGSGRLTLAHQIASADNPLTARVMVNRIWHHLFGRGIVPTVDNFGVLGQDPSHPELLDYLAHQFVDNGWSIKPMIKRMVLSRTYRMSSQLNPAAKEIDPDNVLLHRMAIRRLQGEAIRDSILAVSGRLDRKVYGPSFAVHLTPFMQGRGRPGRSGPVDGDGRRSVYTEIRRNFLPPMLIAFDMPIPFNSIGRRNLSNVPAQALILMNDPFVVGQADVWSKRLLESEPDFEKRIVQMYLEAFSRPPTGQELEDATEFVKIQATEMKIDEVAAKNNPEIWKDLCHVMFNVKEFIYLR